MAKFNLNIETHSAAVAEDGREYEIARLLRATADRVENGETSGLLLDVNGARVGSWEADLPAVLDDDEDGDDEDDS